MHSLTHQKKRNTSALCQFILHRLDCTFAMRLSRFERWPDSNYVPLPLEYVWNQTPDNYKLGVRLHGFGAQDVHMDLCRGHIIILLSRSYDPDSVGQQEYYCEVPIPAGAKQNKALVEIDGDLLTITLFKKKPTVFRRIASEVARLGTNYGLPYGKVLPAQNFEDIGSV